MFSHYDHARSHVLTLTEDIGGGALSAEFYIFGWELYELLGNENMLSHIFGVLNSCEPINCRAHSSN